MKRPIILFRPGVGAGRGESEEEMAIAKKYFDVSYLRTDCRDRFVIGRYSVLPFYIETMLDLNNMGSTLINTYQQHHYVANFQYYIDLFDETPETWFRLDEVPKDSGPWIVKGRTNSRKQEFWDKMYAGSWKQLVSVYNELSNDPLIGPQEIIIRKYVHLLPIEDAWAGADFKNEWRFFFYNGLRLAHGFYWVQSQRKGTIDQVGMDFAQRIATKVRDKVSFVVIDIGQLKDGSWTLIELNDGQMSGLSHVNPEELYGNLKKAVECSTGNY